MIAQRMAMERLIEVHSVERRLRGLAPKTREQDKYGYGLLRATGVAWIDELQPDDAYRAIAEFASKCWKPRTRNICIIQAKTTLSWAVKRHHLESNPWADVDLFEEEECDRRPLTVEEIHDILRASGPRWKLIWQTYISTLCRRDELRLRVWQDFDADAGVIKLPGRKSRNGRRIGTKTKKSRECILGPRLVAALCALRKLESGGSDDPIFPSHCLHLKTADTTPFLSPGIPRLMLVRVCEKLGIDTTGVDLHSLRCTGATLLAELDIGLDVIERMLGHGVLGRQHSLALRKYVKRRDPAVRDATEKLDALLFDSERG